MWYSKYKYIYIYLLGNIIFSTPSIPLSEDDSSPIISVTRWYLPRHNKGGVCDWNLIQPNAIWFPLPPIDGTGFGCAQHCYCHATTAHMLCVVVEIDLLEFFFSITYLVHWQQKSWHSFYFFCFSLLVLYQRETKPVTGVGHQWEKWNRRVWISVDYQ